MKQYGARKATEFTRKQIGVIYGKAKRQELKVEKWIMSEFYDLADYYGYDDNRTVEDREVDILRILEAVFAGDNVKAQELIDSFTEHVYDLTSNKKRATINRDMVA